MATTGALSRCSALSFSINCFKFRRRRVLEPLTCNFLVARGLLSGAHLGIDRYQRSRRQVSFHLKSYKDTFCRKLGEQLGSDNPGILNAVNPTNMAVLLHAAESDQDITTVREMITRFHRNNRENKECAFVFGPVVMRLLHTQNRAGLAYELFEDTGLQDFFSNITNHIILMDMLFESGEFDKCLAVLDSLVQHSSSRQILPVACLTLAFASCLKLNTRQSYKKMQSLFMTCTLKNNRIPMRLVQLSALLCIKQRKAAQGMVLLSLSGRLSQDTDIKLLLNIKLGQLSRATSILERFLVQHSSPKVCQNIINELKEAARGSDDIEDNRLLPLINTVESDLQSKGQVMEESFEKFVLRPIHLKPLLPDGFIERLLSGAFDRESDKVQHKAGIKL